MNTDDIPETIKKVIMLFRGSLIMYSGCNIVYAYSDCLSMTSQDKESNHQYVDRNLKLL